jgi:hypothetical protein
LQIPGNEGFRCGVHPWAKRFERAFAIAGEWEFMREHSRSELVNLENLDRDDARGNYWVSGITPADWDQYYPVLEDAISNVSNSVLSSEYLRRTYALNYANEENATTTIDLAKYHAIKNDFRIAKRDNSQIEVLVEKMNRNGAAVVGGVGARNAVPDCVN